jgi:hypothetical protein
LHSGFGDFLLPYDDVLCMKSNLTSLKFHLDKQTGTIVVEEDFGIINSSDNMALSGHKGGYGMTVGVERENCPLPTPSLSG